jgi:hypothetical protein
MLVSVSSDGYECWLFKHYTKISKTEAVSPGATVVELGVFQTIHVRRMVSESSFRALWGEDLRRNVCHG